MGTKDSLMGRLLGNTEKFTDKQVAETLAMLVDNGVGRGATDIHIEPHERFVLIRYRIDGALRGMHKLPRQALDSVLAQLKTLSGLNAQETHTPQEGSYVADAGGKKVAVHLSTMPVFGGEKAVLHLSQSHGEPADLQSLGFWGEGLNTLKSVLANPHGLVVVAGPRQSGVSSTLFSLLKDLNSPLLSVATVETGAKHRLPGVNQTYLSGGMSIREGFKAALKQDPNIVMLDALPDAETAELAIRAATTGHLILAGAHAEGSVAAVLRLRHAGVEPFLVLTALRACVGQRLVRQLCQECRERYELNHEERQHLEESFGMTAPAARKRLNDLEKSAAPAIFGDVKQISSTPQGVTHLWRPSESGCDACDHSGYKGRIAIVEVLKNSDGLHKALLSKEPASARTVQSLLVKEGFVPMGLDGLVKALRGQTTVAEVLKAMASQA